MPGPLAIIYPYMRAPGYIYLHLPIRVTRECQITSGTPFHVIVKENRIIIEQSPKEV